MRANCEAQDTCIKGLIPAVPQERKNFLLRIDPELWDELNRWAGDELRSVNAQIEFILKRAVVAQRGKKEKLKKQVRPNAWNGG
jgi:hypothetical protein